MTQFKTQRPPSSFSVPLFLILLETKQLVLCLAKTRHFVVLLGALAELISTRST